MYCADACEESEFFLLPFCYTECPKHFFATNATSPVNPQLRAVCLRCHVTCLLCSGPAHTQCLNCTAHRRLTPDGQCIDVDAAPQRISLVLVTAIAVLIVALIGTTAASLWLWLRDRQSSNRLLTNFLVS